MLSGVAFGDSWYDVLSELGCQGFFSEIIEWLFAILGDCWHEVKVYRDSAEIFQWFLWTGRMPDGFSFVFWESTKILSWLCFQLYHDSPTLSFMISIKAFGIHVEFSLIINLIERFSVFINRKWRLSLVEIGHVLLTAAWGFSLRSTTLLTVKPRLNTTFEVSSRSSCARICLLRNEKGKINNQVGCCLASISTSLT